MAIITYDNFQLVKNGKIEQKYPEMLESTAPTFDDSTAYTAGQYVVHNNEIRKFNEAHLAGAWNDSDNETASLEDVLTDINTAIADKGVTVPSGSKLVDCPELISTITGGSSSITTKRINAEVGIKVVDENGYVGATLTNYFPHVGNTYYNNFAVVVNGADFSQSGLGQVTFIEESTVTIGGRTYRTINIGGVTWMAENLDFKFSGCNIGGTGDPTTPNAWYYDNNEATYGIDGTKKCGLLYNWYAVNLLEANKSTLCPGWHVASKTEWESLQAAVGGSSTAGKKLKAINNSIGGNWPTGWGGTDDYYFTALPSGFRSGYFRQVGNDTSFWSSTRTGSSAYIYNMASGRDSINTYTDPHTHAFPTRLVKDS